MRTPKPASHNERSTLPRLDSSASQSVALDNDQQTADRASHDVGTSQSDDDMVTADARDDQSTTRLSPEAQWEQIEEGRHGLEGHIASTDLLNPADALHLLAQVADLETDEQPGSPSTTRPNGSAARMASGPGAAQSDVCHYPPISNGQLTLQDAAFLVKQWVFSVLICRDCY